LTEEDARLYTLGFPAKMIGQTEAMSSAEGMLSNVHGPGGLWQTTLPLNRGNSGGPVFDYSGQVVAVAVGGFDDAHLITFVRPTYQLIGLVQQMPAALDIHSSAPEVQLVRSDSLDDEIETYVTDVWLRDRETYAETVDYFKYGIVDRAFIAKEKKEYADRWPVRKYSLFMGTLRANKMGENTVITTFRFSYRVSNSEKSLKGEGVPRSLSRRHPTAIMKSGQRRRFYSGDDPNYGASSISEISAESSEVARSVERCATGGGQGYRICNEQLRTK